LSFALSKLGWMLLQPSNLLIGLLAVTVLLRWRRLSLLVLALLVAVATLPVGLWLARPLEERFARPTMLPASVAGIIVLGGAQDPPVAQARGVLATKESAERLIEAAALAQRYPDALLVFSGGDGTLLQRGNEGEVNRRFVDLAGLNEGRILYEERSRNTWENALFTRALVQPEPGQTWLLVTSAAHVPRSIGIFRRIGWAVLPFPVDYETRGGLDWPSRLEASERLEELDAAAREWVGLLAYRLMGRTGALLPGP